MRGENSEPLNIHLVWGSVWERNCKDLQRKMMDFKEIYEGGGEERRRRGAWELLKNENPHFGEWWEKRRMRNCGRTTPPS